jgi:hypothetical protein
MTRCDSFSELPGFLLDVGTSWTVRIAMLMKTSKKLKLKNLSLCHHLDDSTEDSVKCRYSLRKVTQLIF